MRKTPRREQGQAMVEFSLIAFLFFLMLLTIVEVGLFWAQESMAATYSTELGVETAVGSGSTCSSGSCSPDVASVASMVMPTLEASMIGTPVYQCVLVSTTSLYQCSLGSSTNLFSVSSCPSTPDQAWRGVSGQVAPGDAIWLCVSDSGYYVTVTVAGYSNAFFGNSSLFGVKGIPIYSTAMVKELTFSS